MVSILASRPSCPGFESQHSEIFFRGKIVDVAESNQQRSLEESQQWLENVDQTYLGLASGKLALQKIAAGSVSVAHKTTVKEGMSSNPEVKGNIFPFGWSSINLKKFALTAEGCFG